MIYLNLGCGSHYNKNWINIDLNSNSPDIIKYDLARGIPLDDNSCDVVYHSHIIEHFRREEALTFMKDCHRVLKSGGIIRVATPDLERICRTYLEKLDMARGSINDINYDYEWILLEMYDQAVREHSGGLMLDYLRLNPLPNESFIYNRIGEEGRNLVNQIRYESTAGEKKWLQQVKIKNVAPSMKILTGWFRVRIIYPVLLGRNGLKAMEIGRFRSGGEVHQWMYDQYSLSRLLVSAGFSKISVQSATSSYIPDWTSFNLDTLPNNVIYKPDSLFIEAIKPE